MTKKELQTLAINLGCSGPLSTMTKKQLQDAISKRRNYLHTAAADIPKTTGH